MSGETVAVHYESNGLSISQTDVSIPCGHNRNGELIPCRNRKRMPGIIVIGVFESPDNCNVACGHRAVSHTPYHIARIKWQVIMKMNRAPSKIAALW